MDIVPGATSLKKTDSFFPSSHQLSLGVGTHELLSIHSGLLTLLILCWFCEGKLSCCEFVSTPVLSHPEKIILPQSSLVSGSSSLSTHPLPSCSLNLVGWRDIDTVVPRMTEDSQTLVLCTWTCCESLHYAQSTSKRRFSDKDDAAHIFVCQR